MALSRSDISISDVTPHRSSSGRFNWHKPDDQNVGLTSWDSLHNYYMGKIYKFHTSRYHTLLQRWCDFQVVPQSGSGVQFVRSLFPRSETGTQLNITGIGFILDGDVNGILSDILFGVRIKFGRVGAPADFTTPISYVNFYNPSADTSPINYLVLGDSLDDSPNSCVLGSGSTKARVVYGRQQIAGQNYFYVPLGTNSQGTNGQIGHNSQSSFPGGYLGYRADRDTTTTDQAGASYVSDLRTKPGAFANSYFDAALNFPWVSEDVQSLSGGDLPNYQDSQADAQDMFVEFQTAGVTEAIFNNTGGFGGGSQTQFMNFKMFDLYGHVTYLDY